MTEATMIEEIKEKRQIPISAIVPKKEINPNNAAIGFNISIKEINMITQPSPRTSHVLI